MAHRPSATDPQRPIPQVDAAGVRNRGLADDTGAHEAAGASRALVAKERRLEDRLARFEKKPRRSSDRGSRAITIDGTGSHSTFGRGARLETGAETAAQTAAFGGVQEPELSFSEVEGVLRDFRELARQSPEAAERLLQGHPGFAEQLAGALNVRRKGLAERAWANQAASGLI